jgi:hypothetical protein
MVDQGLRNTKINPRYAYLAPLYGQVKRVCWDYLKMYTQNIPGATANEADLRVDIPRPDRGDSIRFTLLGADNPDSLRGIYLDGAILDEYADMNPVVWSEVIRPALSDRLGWAIFIGTPKGMNAFYDLYQGSVHGFQQEDGSLLKSPDWFGALYKASETGLIAPSELESNRATMTQDKYDQEFECDFTAALIGAYYSREMKAAEKDGRITDVPYEPMLTVDTFWDLGMDDSTTIWFAQKHGPSWRVIDYLEDSGQGLPYYAKLLKEKPYAYGNAYLPHDAKVREMGTGKSRFEVAYSLGLKPRIVQKLTLQEGIDASRRMIPKCYFDRTKCKRGIEALQKYEKKWDPKRQMFMDVPNHNQWSHGADAFRYFSVGADDRPAMNTANIPRTTETHYNIFTHQSGNY